jgi:hypothetical protein
VPLVAACPRRVIVVYPAIDNVHGRA